MSITFPTATRGATLDIGGFIYTFDGISWSTVYTWNGIGGAQVCPSPDATDTSDAVDGTMLGTQGVWIVATSNIHLVFPDGTGSLSLQDDFGLGGSAARQFAGQIPGFEAFAGDTEITETSTSVVSLDSAFVSGGNSSPTFSTTYSANDAPTVTRFQWRPRVPTSNVEITDGTLIQITRGANPVLSSASGDLYCYTVETITP